LRKTPSLTGKLQLLSSRKKASQSNDSSRSTSCNDYRALWLLVNQGLHPGRVVLGFGYRYIVNEKTTAVHAVLKPLLVTHTTYCPAHHGPQNLGHHKSRPQPATCVAFFAHGSKRHPQERCSAPVKFR